jgi:transposase
VYFSEKLVGRRRYRVAAQAVWDARIGRAYSRQVVLGPANPPPKVELSETRTVGRLRVGDVGALVWAAEQLDVVGVINRACGWSGGPKSVSLGEMVLAVAVQRACAPGAKCHLGAFLDESIPRVSCLPAEAFTGQEFHRLAMKADEGQLESAQLELARAAVSRFKLGTDVLAFDTTNFDTHIATVTTGELARRGHAKSKRSDLRVVGLGVLVSETGHVPLFHRTYAGNSSDHRVLEGCLDGLARLHDALDAGEGRKQPAERTFVRDGGSWSEQMELNLDVAGYYTVVALPLGTNAAEEALQHAATRGAMKVLGGKLAGVRAARLRTKVGELDRTLVVVESDELLEGQKRGIAAALRKAKGELTKLERLAASGRIRGEALKRRATKALRREHLASFVITIVGGTEEAPTFHWEVDASKRHELERTRLGKRVICTDRHSWTNERIVTAFRGQWNVEEIFRRSKKGGVVPWGPSHQWADASLRVHTFATVLGLMLVSLVRLALRTKTSARLTMKNLGEIEATQVRTTTGGMGRRPTWLIAPDITPWHRRAIETFELGRWMPELLSARPVRRNRPANHAVS